MGCCNEKILACVNKSSQFIISDEEEIIKLNEKTIPFTLNNVTKIVPIVKKYSDDGILSMVLLKGALFQLDFCQDNFTDPESQVFKLLRLLQNPQKLFNLNTVILCSILLGSGTSSNKAKHLFELYDTDSKKFLTKDQINSLIKDVIDLAVKKIPLIAAGQSLDSRLNTIESEDGAKPPTIDIDKLNKHIKAMLEKKPIYTNRVFNVLLDGDNSIRMSDFIQKIEKIPLLETLVWSYQIRLELLSYIN